jgi:signal transduction histidine kinase
MSMKRLSFASLRSRLTLLIVLAVLPVMGLTVSTYLEERNLILRHIMSELQLISSFASGTQERFLLTTNQLLVALSRIVVLEDPEPQGCNATFEDILSQNPMYANIGAILPDGSIFCSACPIVQREGFSNQPWFQSSLETRGISLGMGRTGDGEGKPALYFSYQVVDDRGNPRIVVFAAMDLSQFNQIALQMQLPGMAEFLMVSRSGAVLGYFPSPEKFIGETLPSAPLIEAILTKGKGEVEMEGLDGVNRLYSFTPLSSTVETYLYVCIGIPKALAYGEANRGMVLRFVGLGLISLLALSAVWMGSDVFILRRVQALLRSLSSQLNAAEEQERQRLASDLHDGLGQTLAVSKIKLGLLKEAAASNEQAQAIQEIRKLITDAIHQTKSLIFKMSSPILHDLGIEAAMQWLAEQTSKDHSIEVTCEVDNQHKPLDNDVRSFLFRAVCELLINVVKHSKARHATITVTSDAGMIRIGVWDDGIGFDISKTEFRGTGTDGFGLFSIRDRLSYVKGYMEIESQPGVGTKITIGAPLSSTADSHFSTA